MDGITIDRVTFRYPGKSMGLHDIHVHIPKGSFLGITGVNGSGKSTLTYLLNGLIPHSIPGIFEGEVLVDGISTRKKSVSYFAGRVGMVFQNPDFSIFNLTVSEEIQFGLKNLKQQMSQKKITQALESVGLTGYEHRDPQALSFGEKQKVCLAAVLALDVSYIVLDEPTAMLDYKSSIELYELLLRLNKQGKTIITVEHDTDFLWKYSKETLILHHGTVVSFGPTSKILTNFKQLTRLGIKKPHKE